MRYCLNGSYHFDDYVEQDFDCLARRFSTRAHLGLVRQTLVFERPMPVSRFYDFPPSRGLSWPLWGSGHTGPRRASSVNEQSLASWLSPSLLGGSKPRL